MRPVILLLSVYAFCVGAPSVAKGGQAPQLLVGVERSLPVRGRQCQVSAVVEFGGKNVKFSRVEVEFYLQWDGEETQRLAKKSASLASAATSARVGASWTPKRVGACRVSAVAALFSREDDARRLEASPIDVFVTTRELHFNYWGCAHDQRYVTSVMDNSKEGDSPQRWRRRGVLPLAWKGGHWLWKQKGYDKPEKVAENWLDAPANRFGVMIDEFGGGGDVDEKLGEALLIARRRSPGFFLAPYCVGVSGTKMVAGFRQSDLALVETYTSDWRGDGVIIGRWKTAAKAGLKDKSIAVLGVGRKWTTTEKELRRIFDMTRSVCPEMPGIGFFPNAPSRLAEAIDSAIEDYFLRPVLSLSVEGKAAVIRNVGETPAVDVKIAFLDAEKKRIDPVHRNAGGNEKTIPRLDPWAAERVSLPPDAVSAELISAPERYTTLRYTPPSEQPKPDARAAAEALAFRRRAMTGKIIDPLARANEMRIERSDTSHKNPGYHNNIKAAVIPLPSSGGDAIALSFDLRIGRAWFYGVNTVSLAGKGTLSLSWSHNDHDAGLQGDQPRPTLSFTGPDDYTVRDVPIMGFSKGEQYSVLLAYDGRGVVRTVITGESDTLLWDSGPLPAVGGFECRELRLRVRPFRGSEIRYLPERGEIFLRGVGGGPIPSPYVLESTLSNLRLVLSATTDGAR